MCTATRPSGTACGIGWTCAAATWKRLLAMAPARGPVLIAGNHLADDDGPECPLTGFADR